MTQSDGTIVSVERSTLERDLGIMIDSGLQFLEQIHMASKKANNIMTVIRRTCMSRFTMFQLVIQVTSETTPRKWSDSLVFTQSERH